MEQTQKRRFKRKRLCPLKSKHLDVLDYKDLSSFNRYITDRGKIAPRRNTMVSAQFQRCIAAAVKRARFMCLIPHYID